MSFFVPANKKDHELVMKGYSVPDLCLICGNPYHHHPASVCPETKTLEVGAAIVTTGTIEVNQNLTMEELEASIEKIRLQDPRTYAELELCAALRHLPIEAIQKITTLAVLGIFNCFDPAHSMDEYIRNVQVNVAAGTPNKPKC